MHGSRGGQRLGEGAKSMNEPARDNPYQCPAECSPQPLPRKPSLRSFVLLNAILAVILVAVPTAIVRIELARLPASYSGDPIIYETTFHASPVPTLFVLVLYLAVPNCILIGVRRFRSASAEATRNPTL